MGDVKKESQGRREINSFILFLSRLALPRASRFCVLFLTCMHRNRPFWKHLSIFPNIARHS